MVIHKRIVVRDPPDAISSHDSRATAKHGKPILVLLRDVSLLISQTEQLLLLFSHGHLDFLHELLFHELFVELEIGHLRLELVDAGRLDFELFKMFLELLLLLLVFLLDKLLGLH